MQSITAFPLPRTTLAKLDPVTEYTNNYYYYSHCTPYGVRTLYSVLRTLKNSLAISGLLHITAVLVILLAKINKPQAPGLSQPPEANHHGSAKPRLVPWSGALLFLFLFLLAIDCFSRAYCQLQLCIL